MIQYYFGAFSRAVYAVDSRFPQSYAHIFYGRGWRGWRECASKNHEVVQLCCDEIPVTIEQIRVFYPTFKPLESPASPEVNQNGESGKTQSGLNEPGKLAGESVRSLPSLTNGGVGV